MRLKLLAIGLLLHCTGVAANNTVVYRWVDDNNVVHYSHEHPANKDFAEVKVHVAYSPPPPKADIAEEAVPEETDNDDSIDISKMSAEVITQNCESAKVNLNILNSFERILIKEADGTDRALSDEEILEQVELSNKYVDVYCGADKKKP